MKKRATIRDVAKRAGVAPMTVSRVVNNKGYVSDATRQKVEQAVAELDYIPNQLSRSLRSQRTNTIGLIISDITNPYWTTVTRGIEDACSEFGWNVILTHSDEQSQKLNQAVHSLLQRQMDGILLVPTVDSIESVQRIQRQGIPLVLLDRSLPDVNVPVVKNDIALGVAEAMTYLMQLGHRRFGVIVGEKDSPGNLPIRQGIRQVVEQHGTHPQSLLVRHAGHTQNDGYETMRILLTETQERVTAILAGNNQLAMGVISGLLDSGYRVPDDVSVVGIGELPSLPFIQPFLTTIIPYPYRLGVQSARKLIETIQHGDHAKRDDVVLPVEFVERQSCAPLKQNPS